MATQDPNLKSVSDELSYELLRDEWELLLAVGTGPTSACAAAERMGESVDALEPRLELLSRYGLLEAASAGYSLVRAIHERMEGMGSFLRDLVIRRLELGGEAPVAAFVRPMLGDRAAVEALIDQANETVLPEVFEAASAPESERSQRFTLLFAVATDVELEAGEAQGAELVGGLLKVLRRAAVQRSSESEKASAKLWVADMRCDPEIADIISDKFERFLIDAPAGDGAGAAAYAILASGDRDQ